MPQSNICVVCGNECKMMCRSGTGICSENCEKIKDGDTAAYVQLNKDLKRSGA